MNKRPHILKLKQVSSGIYHYAEMEPRENGNWYKSEYVEALRDENKRLREALEYIESELQGKRIDDTLIHRALRSLNTATEALKEKT